MGANLQQSPPITHKQDPKILEHLHFLTRSVPSNLYQLRIKASDSEALILIARAPAYWLLLCIFILASSWKHIMIVFYCVQVSFASVLRVYGVVITDTSKPLSLTSTCTYLTPPWVLALSASTDGKNQCKHSLCCWLRGAAFCVGDVISPSLLLSVNKRPQRNRNSRNCVLTVVVHINVFICLTSKP